MSEVPLYSLGSEPLSRNRGAGDRDLYRRPTSPNLLNHRHDFSGPASRHGSLNSLFQIPLYLPSSGAGDVQPESGVSLVG